MGIQIKFTQKEQKSAIYALYKSVSKLPGGIIRTSEEITPEYVNGFVDKSLEEGISLVAMQGTKLLGEIHAYTPGIRAFQHLLTDLTIVVCPDYHGRGIGRKLFEHFLEQVEQNWTHILRVELFVRTQNQRNISFYESLGFVNEGRQEHKIYLRPGKLETPIHMAWFNPAFCFG